METQSLVTDPKFLTPEYLASLQLKCGSGTGKEGDCCALQERLRPHSLVETGNPPDSAAAREATYPTRLHHRMVVVAPCSSGRRTESSPQTESTTVMLEVEQRQSLSFFRP